MKKEKYPEGHFIGQWMAISTAIFSGAGIIFGISTGNIGLIGVGPAVGVAFGLVVGSSIEAKYKKEGKIRPLTKKEERKRWVGVVAGLIVLAFLVAFGLLVFVMG